MAGHRDPKFPDVIKERVKELEGLAEQEDAILSDVQRKLMEELRGSQKFEDLCSFMATLADYQDELRRKLVEVSKILAAKVDEPEEEDSCKKMAKCATESGNHAKDVEENLKKRISEITENLYPLFVKAMRLIPGSEALEWTCFDDFQTYLQARDKAWMNRLNRAIWGNFEFEKRKLSNFSSPTKSETKEDRVCNMLRKLVDSIYLVMSLMDDAGPLESALERCDSCEEDQKKIRRMIDALKVE